VRSQPSALRIGAAALAVSLAGSYVWFQAAQAGGEKSPRVLAGSKSGRVVIDSKPDAIATTTTAPTTNLSDPQWELLPSSKSAAVFKPPRAREGVTAFEPVPATQPSPATQPTAHP
jgi:hypothetical protein